MSADQPTLAFLGGTGPLGRGLALRYALAGHRVVIGSREAEKAAGVAASLLSEAGKTDPESFDVSGASNEQACVVADVVFVVVPYAGQQATLEPLADPIGTKLVVNCVNPLLVDDRGAVPVPVDAGSAAAECQQLLSGAHVVAAFHHVSAPKLLKPRQPVDMDVLVCGDDEASKQRVIELVREIPGLRPVDAGLLRMAGTIEALTAVLLSVNRRYGTRAGIRITDLPD